MALRKVLDNFLITVVVLVVEIHCASNDMAGRKPRKYMF